MLSVAAVAVQFLNQSIEVVEAALANVCAQLAGTIERTVAIHIDTAGSSANSFVSADQGE